MHRHTFTHTQHTLWLERRPFKCKCVSRSQGTVIHAHCQPFPFLSELHSLPLACKTKFFSFWRWQFLCACFSFFYAFWFNAIAFCCHSRPFYVSHITIPTTLKSNKMSNFVSEQGGLGIMHKKACIRSRPFWRVFFIEDEKKDGDKQKTIPNYGWKNKSF